MITELDVTSFAYGGIGVALFNGENVSIPYSLPGEKLKVILNRDKAGFIGKIVDIVLPSPHRVSPSCPYFGICGGCQMGHIEYNAQINYKKNVVLENLRKVFGHLPKEEIFHSYPHQYRIRASLRILDGKIGFFSYGTNNFVPIEKCHILSPNLFENAKNWAKNIKSNQILTLSVLENNSGDILANLKNGTVKGIKNESPFTGLKLGDAPITVGIKGEIESVNIFGQNMMKYQLPYGLIPVTFDQFFQSNRHLLDTFQNECTKITEGLKTLELYAGSGFFTSALMKKTDSMTAIEINEIAAKLALTEGYPVVPGNSNMIKTMGSGYELIFLNPPREGADSETITGIIKMMPKEIVYVSCNPITLARNLRKLSKYYSLENIKVFDMFPDSYHIEMMVNLKLK